VKDKVKVKEKEEVKVKVEEKVKVEVVGPPLASPDCPKAVGPEVNLHWSANPRRRKRT